MIISTRLRIMDHLITILIRLFHIEKINPNFTISQVFSNIVKKELNNPFIIMNFKSEEDVNIFKSKNMGEKYEIEENLKGVLLEKIDSLVRLISYVNGVYNFDIELYYSEITLHFLENKDMNKLYCLDTFIELFNNKKDRYLFF